MKRKQRLEPFGRRLKQARKLARLTQHRLGELLDMDERNVREYEAGKKEPELHRLPRLAKATGKPVGWFFGEDPPTDPTLVPVYDEVPAGPSIEPLQDAQETVNVPADWLRGRAFVYCLRVKGDSMETLLRNGDLVAVRSQPDAENGEIVVATLPNGEYVVKRLAKDAGQVVLESLNRSHRDIVCDEGTQINGRVIGVIRDLRDSTQRDLGG